MRVPLKLELLALVAAFAAASAFAQSQPPSLGDVARQQQLQKPSPAPEHVFRNEDIPAAASSAEPESTPGGVEKAAETQSSKKATGRPDAGEVRANISAQKQKVKELETKIATDQAQLERHNREEDVQVYERVVNQSVGMGSLGTGVCQLPDYIQEQRGYKDYCEEPAKLQAEVDGLQKQLDSERASLESMQEEARQQGFGNSVYDPD